MSTETQFQTIFARLKSGDGVTFGPPPPRLTPPRLPPAQIDHESANALRRRAREMLSLADRIERARNAEMAAYAPLAPGFSARPETCLAIVCATFHVAKNDLIGKKRNQSIAFARQFAMYALRECTPFSFPHIGRLFRRDHSTVIHARNVIQARIAGNEEFAAFVVRIRESITQATAAANAAANQEVAA